MTTTTATKIRRNSLVIYRGSKELMHGILFRVIDVTTYHGETRYTLAYRGDDEAVLYNVRASSITQVKAKDILHRTCKHCGLGPFWYLRGTPKACPLCEHD